VNQDDETPRRLLLDYKRHGSGGTLVITAVDIRVNYEPKHMVLNPTDDHHAIITPESKGSGLFRYLYYLKEYFLTRNPTQQEYEHVRREPALS
jgi:hypothetical protein